MEETIPEEYMRREREAGGLAKADIKAIVKQIAFERGMDPEDVVVDLAQSWVAGPN